MNFKRISFLVVVCILSMFRLTPVQASERFADVPSSHGAYEEIAYLVNLNVIKGYTEGGKTIFKPNTSVTRGQAAKMVVVATNNKPLIVQKSSFSDVTVGTELSSYVESAVKLGFLSESAKGKFRPNTPLTRDEMSKALALAFGLNVDQYAKQVVPFTDVSSSNAYYKYIAAIYYNGITKGDTTGTKYNAKEAVTRAQFGLFVARASSERYRLDLPIQGVNVPNEADAIAKVVATTDNLNIRSSPAASNELNILGKVSKGTLFSVYEVNNSSWFKVSYNGIYAYISKDYVQFVDEMGNALVNAEKKVKVLGDIAVYQSRDVNGQIATSVNAGETLSVYTTIGNWYSVMVDGLPGYVRVAQTEDIVSAPPVIIPPVVEKPAVVEEPIPQPKPSEGTVVEEEPVVEIPAPTPPTEQLPEQQYLTNTVGKATVSNLHIREQANGSSASVGKIDRGTLVEVHAITGNWAQVSVNGRDGYINKTYLQLLNQSGKAVAGRIIVLDPGHGGKDPGAVKTGTMEKTIALNVANLVKKKLEADGATVKMTRTGDTYPSLTERVQFAKNAYGEVFVSIHANAATSTSAKGTETYYSVTSNDNEKEDVVLATAINKEIVANASMNNRGIKRADYVVIKGLVIPAVLVELGFLTNAEDYAKLTSDAYLEIYAQSIYNGIVAYYTK